MRRLRAAGLAASLAAALPQVASAAELCRYDGAASYAGHVAVEARATAVGDALTVDVTASLSASTWLFNVQYLRQEISTWRGGELQDLAVNARDSVDGRVSRQQWDVFRRDGGGLQARRVQAKTLADLRRRHPGFDGHWAPSTFGEPWLQDYAAANPERRPDLDLAAAAMPPGLRSPLALAFYWSRRLPPGGGAVPVFLPGFKQQARVDLRFVAEPPDGGGRHWRSPVRHPALSDAAASTVAAWVAPDDHLLRLAFDMHASFGSASGVVRAQGCTGTPQSTAD